MSSEEKTDFRPIARGRNRAGIRGERLHLPGGRPAPIHVCRSQGFGRDVRQGQFVEIAHEGKAFGMLSLLDDMPRANTARALEPCELALLDKKKFRFMIEEAPNFVWFVLGEFSSRLRATNALL